jgi:hypothetical protein
VTDMDRAAVERVRAFAGHIEDMPGDEKIYLLDYFAEAVTRLLNEAEPPPLVRQLSIRQYLEVPAIFNTELEMYCLAHRKRVRWLAAPMWWHHVIDRETCWAMADAKAPRA